MVKQMLWLNTKYQQIYTLTDTSQEKLVEHKHLISYTFILKNTHRVKFHNLSNFNCNLKCCFDTNIQ